MATSELEIRFCTAPDNVRIAYGTLGRGPPILKSARWMTHLELDRKSPLWRHWISELSDGRTLTTYDGRGYGLSDRNPSDLSFDAMVGDFEAVADAAGFERFPVVGFCHGGPIAIAYAARFPQRVSCLVLCGTYAQGRAKRDPSPHAQAEGELLLKLIELGWGEDNPAYRQVFTSKAIPGGTTEMFTAYNDLQRASTSPEVARRLAEVCWNIDVEHLLTNVACPTLVLHATRDALVPFEQGRSLAGLIPHARLVPLDSENHDLLETEPAWQTFVAEVQAFLAEHDLPARHDHSLVMASLTKREYEVLNEVARGLSNNEIAQALHRSEKTVRNHVTSIFAKLDVTSRNRAIVLAREAGLGNG